MNQTRKQNSRRTLHPNLPAATARAISEFVPTSRDRNEPLGVEVIDWGIVVVARITSLTSERLSVDKITVNDEFTPIMAINDGKGMFTVLEWPKPLRYGESINAIVQAPLAAAKTLDYCYPHSPTKVTVFTTGGNFGFVAGRKILQG